MTDRVASLKVKLFADGADLKGIEEMAAKPYIAGFTTNPTLMRKAGVKDYKYFALDALTRIGDRPISFEVFADDFEEMGRQAREIAGWGPNVYVKIPVTNTRNEFAGPLIAELSTRGVKLNVTALMTPDQVRDVTKRLFLHTPAVISVFAGRIADTGIDPKMIMRQSVQIMREKPKAELLWASPRALLDVFHAEFVGCHIITATNDILKKLPLIGKSLDEYSLETVQMFYNDAREAGFEIPLSSASV